MTTCTKMEQVHRAIALDGTCTGEHGVGLGKKKYLVEELGEGTVALMRSMKEAIDPDNLFNPGKVSTSLVCAYPRLTWRSAVRGRVGRCTERRQMRI